MTSSYDPWSIVANQSGIEGRHLKFAKGIWSLDGIEIQDEDVQICVLMSSAMHGLVLWGDDRKITDRKITRYDQQPPSNDPPPPGWSPYTSFQCVGADEDHRGQLMTWTSSSWGGRNAFGTLASPYVRKGKREFPICALGNRPKGDVNNNIDPLFAIIGWSDCGNFRELLPPPVEAIEPQTALPAPPRQRAADIIDDDIPF